jgi:hypothetical protein
MPLNSSRVASSASLYTQARCQHPARHSVNATTLTPHQHQQQARMEVPSPSGIPSLHAVSVRLGLMIMVSGFRPQVSFVLGRYMEEVGKYVHLTQNGSRVIVK